jgi:uncharacterized protein
LKHKLYTLITGASEGLGKALALECASRRLNVVLVALPGPELHHLVRYIKRNFAVEAIAIEQDLSLDNSASIVFNKLIHLGVQVNMLINNAGVGNTKLFEEQRLATLERQIRINVMATTTLSHVFVPMLKRNAPSHILNVGSLACFFALPKKQVYGGTKSFIYFFSKSLRSELASDKVNVSVLCPGGINSNALQTMLNKSGTWISRQSLMDPEQVAPLAIRAMLKKKELIIPGRLNRLFLMMDKLIPTFIKNPIIKRQIGKLKEYQPAAIVKQLASHASTANFRIQPTATKNG